MGFCYEIEFFTGFKFHVFPASVDSFLFAAFPDFVERWTITILTDRMTSESNHCTEQVLAFLIYFLFFEKWYV
jgi:hypothetical protein